MGGEERRKKQRAAGAILFFALRPARNDPPFLGLTAMPMPGSSPAHSLSAFGSGGYAWIALEALAGNASGKVVAPPSSTSDK